jgi:uncharacterized coiled-coil DUF342 family protein
LSSTLEQLREEQEKAQCLLEEANKFSSQLASKENEATSLSMDVDFLQNELKTAHKQAANYALERDERATMCDALSTHVTKLKDKISSLETEAENLRKDADLQRDRYYLLLAYLNHDFINLTF